MNDSKFNFELLTVKTVNGELHREVDFHLLRVEVGDSDVSLLSVVRDRLHDGSFYSIVVNLFGFTVYKKLVNPYGSKA